MDYIFTAANLYAIYNATMEACECDMSMTCIGFLEDGYLIRYNTHFGKGL